MFFLFGFFWRKSYFLSVFEDTVCVHSYRCALGFVSVAVRCSEREQRAQPTDIFIFFKMILNKLKPIDKKKRN